MGQKDLSEKCLESFPDVFADTINALLYQGKKIVSVEQLKEAPTETLYWSKKGKLRNQFQDVSKYVVQDGVISAQYTVENETVVKRNTVLRKAGYAGAVYREQYDSKGKGIFPYIGIVLYWGKRKWHAPRSLHQLFQANELTRKQQDFTDDIRLQVYEMAHLPQDVRERFHSDMRIVVDYLAEGKNYVPTKQKIVHLRELLLLLQALTGDDRYTEIIPVMEQAERERGEVNMCELLDKYERRGIEKGMEKGMERVNTLIRKLIGDGRGVKLAVWYPTKNIRGNCLRNMNYRENSFMNMFLLY